MALATQCPHCKTTFKVAHDQLKLRSGLVRCGACKQIFNGIEHLVPPDPPTAPPTQHPAPSAATEAPQKADTAFFVADIAGSKPDATPDVQPSSIDALEFVSVDDPETQTRILSSSSAPDSPPLPAITPPVAEAEVDDDPLTRMTLVDFSAFNEDWNEGEAPQQNAPTEETPALEDDIWPDTQDGPRDAAVLPGDMAAQALSPDTSTSTSAEPGDEVEGNARTEEPATPPEQSESTAVTQPVAAPAFADERTDSLSDTIGPNATFSEADADEEAVADDEEPAFVRNARRRQRWGRATRVFMALAAIVLLAAALGQAAYAFRDQLAARFPQTKPALATLCELTGCQISLPAQIEKVAIESNELQAHANNKNLFTLSLLLHNRSAIAQAWPHVELTLNDKNGMPLVRRALAPRDYLPSDKLILQGIAARSEQSITVTFELSQLQASDYRVYLFYP